MPVLKFRRQVSKAVIHAAYERHEVSILVYWYNYLKLDLNFELNLKSGALNSEGRNAPSWEKWCHNHTFSFIKLKTNERTTKL